PNREPFKCDVELCEKKFSTPHALKYHKTTHIDENDPEKAKMKRPYVCETCGESYLRPQSLKNHVKTHTESKEARQKFKCEK
ncbi:hypothetical protein PMAYCL1PPCAC_01860, partial [Pristionchus mayeri]